MSQTQLALTAGLTRTSVANIEGGRQKILLHTLVVFAEALGVEPGSLIPAVESAADRSLSLDAKQRHFVEAVLKGKAKRR